MWGLQWWERYRTEKADARYGYRPGTAQRFQHQIDRLFAQPLNGSLEDTMAHLTVELKKHAQFYHKLMGNELMHYVVVRMIADVWQEAARRATNEEDAKMYRGYAEDQEQYALQLRTRFIAARKEGVKNVEKYLASRNL